MLKLQRQFVFFVFSMLFLVVCSIPQGATYKNDLAGTAAIAEQHSFRTVTKGYQSGVREPLEAIVRNLVEWNALWRKHASAEANPPPLPTIDFDKEIVIAVFLGEKPTGGHDVEIVSVEQSDNLLLVSYIAKTPSPGGVVTQAFTQPFHIVRMAAQGSGTVRFRRLS